jgi:hypothetical protein
MGIIAEPLAGGWIRVSRVEMALANLNQNIAQA